MKHFSAKYNDYLVQWTMPPIYSFALLTCPKNLLNLLCELWKESKDKEMTALDLWQDKKEKVYNQI